MGLKLTAPAPEKPPAAADGTWLECIACGAQSASFEDVRYTYDDCDDLLKVRYTSPPTWDDFEGRGVWHYSAALLFEEGVSLPEDAISFHEVPRLKVDVGIETLRVKHEGVNPIDSFKDRGMTVGVRVAKELSVGRLACVSTGNISMAFATYGVRGGMETPVLFPAGKIAAGKIAQASLRDAHILEVDGSFNSCLDIAQDLTVRGEAYPLNLLNPFRLEDQKTTGLEVLEEFHEDYGSYPDRIVLSVGNADNTLAFYKAFHKLVQSGTLDVDDVPKLIGVQAEGAAPIVEAIEDGWDETRRQDDVKTCTIATRIDNSVNAPEALPDIRETDGTAVTASDEEITAAQRDLAAEGVGVEPASVASVAGLRKLRTEGVVDADEQVVCLATGHLLEDPDVALEAGDDPEPVPSNTRAALEYLAEQV